MSEFDPPDFDPDDREAMIRKHYQQKDFTGWFDELYEHAHGHAEMIPWARLSASPYLLEWLEREQIKGQGKSAVVVGCGLGDDAEALANYGFDVTAFDISPHAIEWCQGRFPNSRVNYVVADLFNPPEDWESGFDLVFESFTIQALPQVLREQACVSVADLVADSGILLLLCFGREHAEPTPHIPFPISREELATMHEAGLTETSFEDSVDSERGFRRFRVTYQRNA